MTEIRKSCVADEPMIRTVHELAFGPSEGPEIADLTHALLHDPTAEPVTSLLACAGVNAIGHVLFSGVRIQSSGESPKAHILAPLAVVPERQGRGTGTRLVQRGLELLGESGSELVFVLGHPGYYPRFGFTPAGRHGLSAPYPIPEEHADAWMVLELKPGAVTKTEGTVLCADALSKREHWVG